MAGKHILEGLIYREVLDQPVPMRPDQSRRVAQDDGESDGKIR
jgi:hypothetical protein